MTDSPSYPATPPTAAYRGRFAPSPSGLLHIGSLIAALASYLDARANKGVWLVRMEDIDPPREQAGAKAGILHALEAHHLFWDESVLYQSERLKAYADAAAALKRQTYHCVCTRKRIVSLDGVYDGLCRHHKTEPDQASALRLRTDVLPEVAQKKVEHFSDLFRGEQQLPLVESGDFIIRRKDGLFAYQLAVCVDDLYQGITHIVRGADLIDSTSRQRYLLQLLDSAYPLPAYGHIPLAMKDAGNKWSKQTGAPALDNNKAFHNLCAALTFLQHPPPPELIHTGSIPDLLQWAVRHWQRKRLPDRHTIFNGTNTASQLS